MLFQIEIKIVQRERDDTQTDIDIDMAIQREKNGYTEDIQINTIIDGYR